MPAQIRPSRMEVTDRFPMLSFTIRTSGAPRVAEVVIATDPALFTRKEGRTSETFYTSREHGLLSIPHSEAVFVVPPEVLGRFVAAKKLWFGLATATPPAASDWAVDVLPSANSPYVSLSGLTDRSLRRVRMFTNRGGAGYGSSARGGNLEWAGDKGQPGTQPAPSTAPAGAAPATPDQPPAATPANGAPANGVPASAHYDDGFGPLPPLQTSPSAPGAGSPPPAPSVSAAPPAPASAGTPPVASAAQSWSRGLSDDEGGIDGPVFDLEPEVGQAMSLDARPRALTQADYSGVTRLMPSPAYSSRNGRTIDRIVIHITGAPQSPYIGSHFTREDANSSAHYMVDQSGNVLQFVREQDKAWHAGSANSRSIGIEHVAIQQGGARYQRRDGSWQTFPYTPPTQAELDASAALVAYLCLKYSLTPDRTTIIGHREADPSTTHSVCPDGAWDWDGYMALVAAAYAAQQGSGQQGSGQQGSGQSGGGAAPTVSQGLDASQDYRISADRQSASWPGARVLGTIEKLAIRAAMAATPLGSTLDLILTAAAPLGLSVGIGVGAGAGAQAGVAVSAGLIFDPNGDIGVYGGAELDVGVIFSASVTGQLTLLRGHIADFSGSCTVATVSAGEEIVGGVSAIFNSSNNFVGVTLAAGLGVGSPISIYIGVQRAASATIVSTQGYSPAARALSSGDTIEIKYRAFIPSPAIKGPPMMDSFAGDGRGFSYAGGTSRGEITFTVDMADNGSLSNLRISDRHWAPSHSYSNSDTPAVAGKPDWWLDLAPGAAPLATATCATTDDSLNAMIGAPGTARNLQTAFDPSSLVTIIMSGNNPLATGSPSIDADMSVFLRRGANGIEARVQGSHDGFPAHEVYVNRKRVYGYDPVAAGNTPTALFPPMDIDVSGNWTSVSAAAQSQGLGVTARALSGSSLVFTDVPGPWHTVDYKHAKLTAIAWDNAPSQPVAFVFFGHPNVDFDGSPTAYHPDDTGDDNLANAGNASQGWFGLVAKAPNDPAVTSGNAIIDQRPERGLQGRFPVIQQAANGDPAPGYYVSATSRAANPSLPDYAQNRYFDASRVPFGALSGKLGTQGVALGDFGLAIRHDRALQSAFYFVDSGGTQSYALGEGSQKVGTNLGGSGRGNSFNNNFPVSFIVFPRSANPQGGALDEAAIAANATALLAALAGASNARDIALLMAGNEVAPGGTPAGKAGLDPYSADPNRTPPRNYATIVAGLANFGLALPAPTAATAQGYAGTRALDADDWTVNWDDVEMIPQPTNKSCWATAAAMVLGWRDRQSVDPTLLARCAGMDSSLKGGLLPQDKRAFVDGLGLTIHPNACYTADGFKDILEANGPVWVTADVPGIHAIVVTGMYRQDGQFFVRITDPWDRVVGTPSATGAYIPNSHVTGSRYIMPWDAFTSEFEAAGNIDRIQLVHSGGTFGHTINRGSAASVGYAQGLGSGADSGFGVGVSVTRSTSSDGGRSYDLIRLSGLVQPANALAGGAMQQPLPGQRVTLDDWPYIDGPSGRTSAPVAIDWSWQSGAVGEVMVAPAGGQVLDGWTAKVSTDVSRADPGTEKAGLKLRVTTTFCHPGESDQVAVSDVLLTGDGRSQVVHAPDAAAPAPAPVVPAAQPALQPA